MPGFDAVVELSSLDGTNGFQISGEANSLIPAALSLGQGT